MPLFRWKLTHISDVFRLFADFLGWAIGILLSAATAAQQAEELRTTFGQGVLNYRTGQLDNGLDPLGWYERD